MSQDSQQVRFGLWYDFRNPPQWRQASDRLYREILDQIVWGEHHGFDDVWLSEHHFIDDGYLPSILPAAAAIAARITRIRIASGVLLMPFHNPGSRKNKATLRGGASMLRGEMQGERAH
jgi:alkanesulfonate monooxygenase SsuD/methylene tetrahydromethanopterin reductase-like flavin-dependent oxidoreductase (luciferase family)